MSDIARVISELERQRATIDRAIAALREVEGDRINGIYNANPAVSGPRQAG